VFGREVNKGDFDLDVLYLVVADVVLYVHY